MSAEAARAEGAEAEPKPTGWRRALPWAVVLVPLLAVFGWTDWVLGQVDAIEREIRPLGGLAYATFVQLVHDWSTGAGWTQTVHRGYADDWRWGGHYTPLLFVTGWLASLSSSPWALARVQVLAVGLGGLAAWKLGRDEAKVPGGIVGLILYFGSGPVTLLALADYQDLVLVLPLFPLAVWAARHARWQLFVVIAALFGAAREEALLLLPFVGLSGGWRRALMAAGVTAAYLGVYRAMGAPPYPNPLFDILTFQVGRAAQAGPAAFVSFSPNLYGTMAGAGWPWLLVAPHVALPGVFVAAFHAQDPTSVGSVGSPAIHHLAPLTGAAIAAGIVGVCRMMKIGPRAAMVTLVLVGGVTWSGWWGWRGPLLEYALRAKGGPAHPAWELLAQVGPDEALLVPESVAPAAALRRKVVTLDSLGDRVQPGEVHLALDDGRLEGTVIASSGSWRLLKDPVLPAARRPGEGGAPQGGLGRQ